MKKVFGYLAPHKGRIAYGLTLKFVGTVAELVLPMVMAYMIDEVAPTGSVRAILLWGGVMLACAVAAFACNVVANRSASRVARDSTRALRGYLFAKTLSLSARQADEVTVPSLVSRLSSDTYNIHTMIGMIQRLGIRTPIMLVGGVALTFFVEPVLALVLLATVPVLSLIVVLISRRGIVLYTALQRASDGMVRKVRDDYTGMRVIKALSKTECESRSFAEVNAELSRRAQRAALTTGITNPLLNALLNLGMVAVIAVIASVGLAVTGVVMGFFSGNVDYAVSETVLQWCIFIHFCCAGIMAIFLPVHIYMAALAPGEGPALRSMFTGFVPEHHAEHHNPLWYASLKKNS